MPLDARTDLFSLGTVIYEMATGKTPFGGGSTADVFVALLREDPPPVSTLNPAMPKKLDAIVAKLLAQGPGAAVCERRGAAGRSRRPGVFKPQHCRAVTGAAKGPKWPWALPWWCCC